LGLKEERSKKQHTWSMQTWSWVSLSVLSAMAGNQLVMMVTMRVGEHRVKLAMVKSQVLLGFVQK